MYAALTVRQLKPDSFDAWRAAWEPDEWPQTVKKAFILRNLENPNEVIAFGFSEASLDELTALRDDAAFQAKERERSERIAPTVESETVSGFYEVVEVVKPAELAAR